MSEYAPLRFHVPEPAVRPGDAPDFSNVPIPEAGSVRRPAIDADPESIRDLAYSISACSIPGGQAIGPWAGSLSDEDLLVGLKEMMTLRSFDARMLMAQRGQDVVLYAAYGRRGGELRLPSRARPGDMNFPTYRQAGLSDRRAAIRWST